MKSFRSSFFVSLNNEYISRSKKIETQYKFVRTREYLNKILAVLQIKLVKKMHLFQTIQKIFVFVGISSYQSMQVNPFDRKLLLTIFSYSLTIISFDVYLIHVANTFWEYNDNIYINSASTLAVICYIFVVFKMKIIFQIISDCETVAVKSE